MDVRVPEIPESYQGYRSRLQAFIAANLPELSFKPKVGLRVPDEPEDVVKLRAWVRALHEAGYVPARYSESEIDEIEEKIRVEELTKTGVPHALGNGLVAGALKHFGTEAQKAKYLTGLATGEHIWTQLFSEPDAGSDLTSLQARAERDGDFFVVTGQKVWSTWAQFSDYGYLLARTEPGTGRQGISAFILDMNSPGVTTRPLREITGTTDFNEVFMDAVRIPVENLIGEVGQGWAVATASLSEERGQVGQSEASDPVVDLMRLAQRSLRPGGRASADAGIRQKMGALAARSRIHRYLSYRTQTKALQGQSELTDAPLTKIWFSETNLDLCELGMEIQGAAGGLAEGDSRVVDEGRWQDGFLYARAWTIAGGSNEIMRNMIAERGLGLPREPRG